MASLQAIHKRNMLRYFMSLAAAPSNESQKRLRKRSIRINGMDRRSSMQMQGSRDGSMPGQEEPARNTVPGD